MILQFGLFYMHLCLSSKQCAKFCVTKVYLNHWQKHASKKLFR